MRDESWIRVEGWWADLFGRPKALLWQGISVSEHAGLGDYPGIFFAFRNSGCHISLPDWAGPELAETLGRQTISRLREQSFWQSVPSTADLRMIGPSVHAYTDLDPGGVEDVEPVRQEDLDHLREVTDPDEWNEGGFAGQVIQALALRDSSGQIVAAANLTEFMGCAADVGVVVAPSRRGQGLGTRVGRAATSYAVNHGGIARWRALTTNVASRRAPTALGFEDYCDQAALR